MADDEEEEFQSASTTSHNGSSSYKRVYIGNLPPIANDSTFPTPEALQEALETWMCEQIPNLSLHSMQIHSSTTSSTNGKTALHALVDCGAQANTVIRILHQKSWQGRKLNVQRERRNNNPKGNKITSSKYSKNTKNNHPNAHGPKKAPFGGKGWSAPKPATATAATSTTSVFTKIPIDQATRNIKSVVEEEFKHAEATGEDPMNVAIAATAAASLLAAMGAFGDDEDGDDDVILDGHDRAIGMADNMGTDTLHGECDDADHDDEPADQDDTPFRIKPMSELLADFGEQDLNWQKQLPTAASGTTAKDASLASNSQLAPKGKAPIHVCLTSFGFSKGGPKRMDGWSHRQPLLPLDCREFPTVPPYLVWQDGLSGAVKRALQYTPRQNSTVGQDPWSSLSPSPSPTKPTIYNFARKTAAPQVFEALLEAQNKGGHGYASPLDMTIYVGSDLGRHRSVVVCEWAAIQLRKLLRQNTDNAILQPVSVSTCHRDVEPRRQQQKNYHAKNAGTNANELQGKTLKKKQMDMAGDW